MVCAVQTPQRNLNLLPVDAAVAQPGGDTLLLQTEHGGQREIMLFLVVPEQTARDMDKCGDTADTADIAPVLVLEVARHAVNLFVQ